MRHDGSFLIGSSRHTNYGITTATHSDISAVRFTANPEETAVM